MHTNQSPRRSIIVLAAALAASLGVGAFGQTVPQTSRPRPLPAVHSADQAVKQQKLRDSQRDADIQARQRQQNQATARGAYAGNKALQQQMDDASRAQADRQKQHQDEVVDRYRQRAAAQDAQPPARSASTH